MAHEEQVIEYLSKEIEAHTNGIMLLRARIAFAIFAGPFFVLGSIIIATKTLPKISKVDGWTVLALLVLCACFLTMGLMVGRVEGYMWNQCNKWRELIAKLQRESAPELAAADLVPQPEKLTRGRPGIAYLVIYFVLLLSFLTTIFLTTRMEGADPPGQPPTPSVTVR